MSLADDLRAAPLAQAAIRALNGDPKVWIAGGAVRDAALGREVSDLDLAVAGDPGAVAKALGRELGEHAFELSAEFGTWRVVARSRGWQVDVTVLRGETIEADLAARDFTVGAVAVPLAAGEAIDPFEGLVDLERGVLRAVGPASFEEDPLRLLRAARLAEELNLGSIPAPSPSPTTPPPAPPSPPASASWPSCAGSSAAPTRCADSPSSTSSASPPSSSPSWRRRRASARAPTTTSTSTGTRSRCWRTRSRSRPTWPATSAPTAPRRPPRCSPSRSPTRWTAPPRCASAPSSTTSPSR